MGIPVTISENDNTFGVLFYKNPQSAWIIEKNTLNFVAVNDAAVKQYGYTRDEFLSSSFTLVSVPGDHEYVKYLNGIQLDEVIKKELTHVKKDGTTMFVEVTSYSVQFCYCNCLMIIVNDITEKKLKGINLKDASARISNADIINAHNKKLQDLAFINSHLIRKPLANILGIIYSLEGDLEEEYRLDEYLSRLKLSANELDAVIMKINMQLEH